MSCIVFVVHNDNLYFFNWFYCEQYFISFLNWEIHIAFVVSTLKVFSFDNVFKKFLDFDTKSLINSKTNLKFALILFFSSFRCRRTALAAQTSRIAQRKRHDIQVYYKMSLSIIKRPYRLPNDAFEYRRSYSCRDNWWSPVFSELKI